MKPLVALCHLIRWIAWSNLLLTAVAMAQAQAPSLVSGETVTAQPPDDAVNLIRNGDFDQPDSDHDSPAHWQSVDNLVFHWTTDPADASRDKVIRINTSVEQKYALQWWVRRYVRGEALNQAPPYRGAGNYAQVGAEIGGFYASDLIPVKPGGAYKVYIDAKGPKSLVFVRGYEKDEPLSFGDEQPRVQEAFREARGEPTLDKNGRPIRYRLRYRYQRWFVVGGSDQWQTYTHLKPCHPNSREITEDVRYIRITLYPHWPPGEYWFDRVRVIEVEPEPGQAKPDAEEPDLEEGRVIR